MKTDCSYYKDFYETLWQQFYVEMERQQAGLGF